MSITTLLRRPRASSLALGFTTLTVLSAVALSQPSGQAPSGSAPSNATPALPESWVSAFQWRSIGPANMSGRITAISVFERDPVIWYASTASGGLLKTTNNGITFEHQFNSESTVAIGDVAVSQIDPNVVWVGTGEANPRNSSSWGDGVYKSTDGGKTWTNMGLRGSFQVGRILIHPENHDVVYVGALGRLWGTNEERGLYKSTDGGKTWTRTLYVDEKTGVVDIQFKPGEPGTMLAATYERQRDAFDTNEPAKRNGPGSALWRSIDGGDSWVKIGSGLPESNLGRMGISYYRADPDTVYLIAESEKTGSEPPNAPYIGMRGADAEVGAKVVDVVSDGPAAAAGLKADDIVVSIDGEIVQSYNDMLAKVRRRVAGDVIKVELSRNREPVTVEIALTTRPDPATRPRARDGTGRRTDDVGGAGTFSAGLGGQRQNLQDQQGPEGHQYGGVYKSTDGGETWTRINSLNPRPMYFSKVRCDPNDDSNLWVLGVALWKSKDNGKTFTDDGGRGTHADHHALWINPRDSRHMILGNDGGIYISYDSGANWDHLNHVAIGQFYHVAVDPRPAYYVYGGLQDNGTWGGPARSRSARGPINEDWVSIGGGDGFICQVDPNDPDQVYFESQNGATGRFNLRTGERASIRPAQERNIRYRWNWRTPFILSSHNSRIYYNAGNYVFRSLDQGRNLRRISDEFTRTRRGSGTAIAESPFDPDVLYVGSDDGALLVTRDGGRNWTKLADFPLSDEERAAVARAEETETPGGPANVEDAPPTRAERPSEPPPATPPAPEAERAEQPAADRSGPRTGGRGGDFAARLVEQISRLDADGDGKISRAEVPEAMLRFFDTGDADGDGFLDEAEIKALPDRLGGARRAGAEPAREAETRPQPPEGAPRTEDPVSGEWTARAAGDELPQPMREFRLSLALAADGKVSGTYEGFRGGGTITDGKFDREKGELTASVETELFPVEIRGRIAEGKLRGVLEAARFQFEFEAERTSRAASPSGRAERAQPAEPGRSLLDLLPGARWVSSIETSRFRPGRVYVTFDGHRSDDDEPYAFVSEDFGATWRSVRGNLATSAGSVKVLREDIQRENVLYLGTEFGAYVSIDRGTTWTRFNNNLPTVAIFEFAQHPTSGEIVAATHGRSIWILDVTPIRQMTAATASEDAALFAPRAATYWRTEPRRGGTNRRFVGENDESAAVIHYALGKRPTSISLKIVDAAGETIRELAPRQDIGLHRIAWDLRRTPEAPRQGAPAQGGFGGQPRGRLVAPGTYRAVLSVDGATFTKAVVIRPDPEFPDFQPWERAGGFGLENEENLHRLDHLLLREEAAAADWD